MAEIRIESKSVADIGIWDHLYLVYRDDLGQEFVLRGGPENHLTASFSQLIVEVGVPIHLSVDSRTNTSAELAERGSTVLDLGDKAPFTVWRAMLDSVADIDNSYVDYDYSGPNSNTVIMKVLAEQGIDVSENLPPSGDNFPGLDAEDLTVMNTEIETNQKEEMTAEALTAFSEGAMDSGSGYVAYLEQSLTQSLNTLANMIDGVDSYENSLDVIVEATAELPLTALLKPGFSPSDLQTVLTSIQQTAAEASQYASDNAGLLSAAYISALSDLAEVAGILVGMVEASIEDPLVLDLNGDGVQTISIEVSQADFNLTEEQGLSFDHGWVSSEDAFLALDKNGNGVIDDINELFGSSTRSGFSELSDYDSDGNGLIDIADPSFAALLLWSDTNGDGISQQDELTSLSEKEIASISLDFEKTSIENNGNIITELGSFTYENGETGGVADVGLSSNYSSIRSNGKQDIFDFSEKTGDHKLNLFEDDLDIIRLQGEAFEDLEFSETAAGVTVTTDNGLSLLVANTEMSVLTADDFSFA